VTHDVAEVEPLWQPDEVVAHGVVDDEPRDRPRDVPLLLIMVDLDCLCQLELVLEPHEASLHRFPF
jgi:hypothetical protein